MSQPSSLTFHELDLEAIAPFEGRVAIVIGSEGRLSKDARRINKLTRGGLERFVSSDRFEKLGQGDVFSMAFPNGLAATSLDVVKLDRKADAVTSRKAGAAIARVSGSDAILLCAMGVQSVIDLAFGLALRRYKFDDHKTGDDKKTFGETKVMCSKAEDAATTFAEYAAVAAGVFETRNLVSEPANVLTTTEFAERIKGLAQHGLEVEILEESDLEKIGMRLLLSVGQGSDSPSKVAIMKWSGGAKDAAPLALIGKGVVFDTGGISLKPSAGMEEMTMDMGGAGVVTGVMKALALRKASANVVGVVGLVENMPSGKATRPGDIVASLKGDTVENVNTDAEGRLVLADIMWYAQERFNPCAMIDLATLTGAIIVALGNENAGVFSNDDTLANAFLKSAEAEGEGAWRMPMGKGYDKLLASKLADMKNVGGRAGGSITAAQFLQRFVKEGTAWMHLDIAGVALLKTEGAYSPAGATGWGVLALNRLIRDKFEA